MARVMPLLDYRLAMAAAQDAANRRMRAAGREAWDEGDYAVACDTFERLYGPQMRTGEGVLPAQ